MIIHYTNIFFFFWSSRDVSSTVCASCSFSHFFFSSKRKEKKIERKKWKKKNQTCERFCMFLNVIVIANELQETYEVVLIEQLKPFTMVQLLMDTKSPRYKRASAWPKENFGLSSVLCKFLDLRRKFGAQKFLNHSLELRGNDLFKASRESQLGLTI